MNSFKLILDFIFVFVFNIFLFGHSLWYVCDFSVPQFSVLLKAKILESNHPKLLRVKLHNEFYQILVRTCTGASYLYAVTTHRLPQMFRRTLPAALCDGFYKYLFSKNAQNHVWWPVGYRAIFFSRSDHMMENTIFIIGQSNITYTFLAFENQLL